MKKRNERSTDFGKIPPQAIEVEENILGSIMIEGHLMDEVSSMLTEEMFYKESHSSIFKAITELYRNNNPVDITSVMQQLKKNGTLDSVGGITALMDLTDRVVTTTQFDYYAKIVSEKYMRRKMIGSSMEICGMCYDESEDIFDIISASEGIKDDIMNGIVSKSESSTSDLVRRVISEIKEHKNVPNGITGVPSGFTDIDKITGGFQKSDLVILAARPGMGKTSFALKVAFNASVKAGKKVAIFSLEMSEDQLMNRLLSMSTGINLELFKKGKFSESDINSIELKGRELSKANMYWDDTSTLTMPELRAKCRKMKRKYGIEMIVIDYLQLLHSGRNEKVREQEIGFISRGLKSLAKELSVPIIALSQLSREVDKRTVKRPLLSDLRESGSIEQDADMVCFLYRPDYYGESKTVNGQVVHGLTEFIIAKNRNGDTDDSEVKFIKQTTNFVDVDIPFEETKQVAADFSYDPTESSPF